MSMNYNTGPASSSSPYNTFDPMARLTSLLSAWGPTVQQGTGSDPNNPGSLNPLDGNTPIGSVGSSSKKPVGTAQQPTKGTLGPSGTMSTGTYAGPDIPINQFGNPTSNPVIPTSQDHSWYDILQAISQMGKGGVQTPYGTGYDSPMGVYLPGIGLLNAGGVFGLKDEDLQNGYLTDHVGDHQGNDQSSWG